MTELHLEIRGRVQGVGFRWFVRETARQLELSGWVKNRRDGAVEIAAAGSSDAVSLLEREVRRGPPGAVVEHVEELPADQLGLLPYPFTVHRE